MRVLVGLLAMLLGWHLTAAAGETRTETQAFPGIAAFSEEQVNAQHVGAGPTFTLPNHKNAIGQLKGLKRQCTERLMSAQWKQDILHQLNSYAHFDNCAFDEGVRFVDAQLAKAKEAAPKHPLEAMEDLGRALHAIQDFYAHSNYVDLMQAEHASFGDVTFLPIWTPVGEKALHDLIGRTPQGLNSGVWKVGRPKDCAAGVPSHGEINKDSATSSKGKVQIAHWESMTHFQAAFDLANRATRAFLDDAFNEAPALKSTCGDVIGFLELGDRRP